MRTLLLFLGSSSLLLVLSLVTVGPGAIPRPFGGFVHNSDNDVQQASPDADNISIGQFLKRSQGFCGAAWQPAADWQSAC